MYHSFTFTCDHCGDQKDLATDSDDGGRCHECTNGRYRKSGESYDQEYVDEMKYNIQQDKEYEERHRYDRD